MTSGVQGPAFFHRRSTHKLIDELRQLDAITLYVGAGASIERTGLTWEGLSAQLLDTSLGDFSERIELVRASSSLAVSSAISHLFETSRTDGWRDRLRETICDLLYRGPEKQASYFNDRVLGVANDLVGAGRSVVVVTPNYDQFLLEALKELQDLGAAAFKKEKVFAFGVDKNGDPIPLEPQLSELKTALADRATLCVVYLHGFVARTVPRKKSLKAAYPVVSEADYAATRSNSQEILGELFRDRDAIIVGSSITDPPLIHALLEARKTLDQSSASTYRGKRFAIIPTHGALPSSLSTKSIKSLRRVEELRAAHLGVRLVTPPYYFQAPQILEELRVDLVAAQEQLNYSDPQALHRYGARLSDWWWSWLYDSESRMAQRQEDTYKFLEEQALPVARDILGAAEAENLKLEAWIRWQPEERELALWASSTGSWPDSDTMRRDLLAMTTTYAATKAFLNGAPTYMKSMSADSRWKAYLAKPIRHMDKAYGVYQPVGVLCVASMNEQDASCINPQVRGNTAELFNYLDSVGTVLFSPDFSYSFETEE